MTDPAFADEVYGLIYEVVAVLQDVYDGVLDPDSDDTIPIMIERCVKTADRIDRDTPTLQERHERRGEGDRPEG